VIIRDYSGNFGAKNEYQCSQDVTECVILVSPAICCWIFANQDEEVTIACEPSAQI
jgi:hypothetical protein